MAEKVNLIEVIKFSPKQHLQSKTDHKVIQCVKGLKNRSTKFAVCEWKKDI